MSRTKEGPLTVPKVPIVPDEREVYQRKVGERQYGSTKELMK